MIEHGRKGGYIRGMKRAAPGLLLICLGAAAHGDVVSPVPAPFPAARYQQMSAKSPFAVGTAAAPTAAPTPGFAANLYVNGVARIGATDYVTIKTKGEDKGTIFLAVGKSSDDGMKVDSVVWSDEMGKTKVYVTKAGEKATLSFDETAMAKVPVPDNPGMRIVPGQRGPQFPMPPGARPGGFPQQPGMGPPGGDPSRIQFRRRARIPGAP
jgi:hypothetical protein